MFFYKADKLKLAKIFVILNLIFFSSALSLKAQNAIGTNAIGTNAIGTNATGTNSIGTNATDSTTNSTQQSNTNATTKAQNDLKKQTRKSTGKVYSEDQQFKGALRKETALALAVAKARYVAMDDAARSLVLRPDVQAFANSTKNTAPLDPFALAYAVYTTEILPPELAGFSPELSVRAGVGIVPRYSAPNQNAVDFSVTTVLNNPELLFFTADSIKKENSLLKELISLSDAEIKNPTQANKKLEMTVRFKKLTDALSALELFREVLPNLQPTTWSNPEQVVETMKKAIQFDQDNPLILGTLGEALLVEGKSQDAIDYLSSAIKLDKTKARMFHMRGVAYMSLHLPALAIEDFSSALELNPNSPTYYNARGAAYLFQADYKNMCKDFYSACTFDSCQNYQWGIAQGYCKK
ncbi:tetratricopeptide repeat protein [Desulfovibrio litoralis]|nr:hypothetical protein [Desulfovibrio litoralis]